MKVYFSHHMPWYRRGIGVVGGLPLICPGTVTDIIGIAVAAAVIVMRLATLSGTNNAVA